MLSLRIPSKINAEIPRAILLMIVTTLLVLTVSPRAHGEQCIDSFSRTRVETVKNLWTESPWKPGTQYIANSRAITESFFNDLVDVTEQIRKNCGEDCLMVGIGRSPTALIAQAQIMGSDAINMPLSKFRPLLGYNAESLSSPLPEPYNNPAAQSHFYELNARAESFLFAHFDQFIGSRLIGKKKIMIVDLAQSGASAFATQKYLNKWLAARDSAKSDLIEVASTYIVAEKFVSLANAMKKVYGVDSLSIVRPDNSAMMVDFDKAGFDSWSEFSSFELYPAFTENSTYSNGERRYPYAILKNTLAILNLQRFNDPKKVPAGTKLPTAVYWDLKTKTARNRETGNPVILKFHD